MVVVKNILNPSDPEFQILLPLLNRIQSPRTLYIAILSDNQVLNSYDVINMFRIFGGALKEI